MMVMYRQEITKKYYFYHYYFQKYIIIVMMFMNIDYVVQKPMETIKAKHLHDPL